MAVMEPTIFDHVKYTKDGEYVFSRSHMGTRITIPGNEWTPVTLDMVKKLKLRTLRNDDNTALFIFMSDLEGTEPDPNWESKSMDREIERDKEMRKLKMAQDKAKAEREAEKERLEADGDVWDNFGPLENTPAWDELSSSKKGGIRKQRESFYGYRIITYKGGVKVMSQLPLKGVHANNFVPVPETKEQSEDSPAQVTPAQTLGDI